MFLIEETQSVIDRALVVQMRWIERILSGEKVWEMRSTKTKYRGRFRLIGSGTGLIFGEVNLVDSLGMLPEEESANSFGKHAIPPEENHLLSKYKYPWVLENPYRYRNPLPYRHPQGAVIWVKAEPKIFL